MSYLPFARKWRPQDFDEVIGQEHITTTLKNAISMDRLHHAYLFAGPRGIGKTSTARIFSKALNCAKGPSPKPCSKCTSCQEIVNGSSLDVIEIDGASNNGVDEIRNLRETVKFSPLQGKYKIYIIDEVHMLTIPAFNALLKTLEEPPAHVKFIFATTEPHKLPATILSRCQRFDFRRIPLKDIIVKLKEVAKEEKLDIEEDVFLYIGKASDGSMRDAESILDQTSSLSKGKATLKDVVDSLGMIEQETLFRSADLIIERNTKEAIHLVGRVLDSGKDEKQFLTELLEHFRNIMIAKAGISSGELIDLPKEAIERINKQSQSFSQGDIFYILNTLSNSLRMIKQLLPARIVLELCMIKLTLRDSISSIEELLSKLPEITPPQEKPEIQTPPPQIKTKPEVQPPQENTQKIVPHDGKSSVDMTRLNNAWPILIKAIAVKRMSISSYLSEGMPDSVKGDTVYIAFPKGLNFHREVLEEKQNLTSIESTLSQILDASVKLRFIPTDKVLKEPNGGNALPTKEELKKQEPIIDATLNIFGGKLLRDSGNA